MSNDRWRRMSAWLGLDAGLWLILLVALSLIVIVVELVFGPYGLGSL